MKGIVTKIEESAFGGDILTIDTTEGVMESRGFVNGRDIRVAEGTAVQFTPHFNNISNCWYAKEIEVDNLCKAFETYIESCNQLEGVKL